MDKIEFLKKLDALNLNKNQYCIISGGVMLMYNLKDTTNDIDIKVTSKYFDELKRQFDFNKSNKFSYLYELNDEVEVAVQDFLVDDVIWIDGYPVEKIEKELEWKLSHNRPKDQEAIELIREYLKRN